jgi:hypothetical protein
MAPWWRLYRSAQSTSIHPPIAYDLFDGERRQASGGFVVRRDGRITFESRVN